jgi:FkbM family methyltransferase
VNVLFVMRHSGYVRNFESTLRLLCDRGHRVHLAFQTAGTHGLLDPSDTAGQLCDRYPRFSRGVIPGREDAWGYAARELRTGLDYLRYLAPEYADAPKLVARAARDAPAGLLRRVQQGPLSTGVGRAVMARWLRALHDAVPTDPRIDAYLEANRPDVLMVTPLIEPGSPQAEYVRSASALGIRTALCVASWDNLTNKGLIHGAVDLVTVWNDVMKREAVTLHGVPASRVTVTGAQPFDHWFDWKPRTTRDEFCARVGLPSDRPYLLYLCSSRFIAPEEVPFVRRWLGELRQSSSPVLQQAGVLIRPHPQNAEQWKGVDLDGLGPVVVHPAQGAAPSDKSSRAEYFDSMFHSASVVGINTTAEIESAIVGRPVFTVLAPEFKDTQEGTLHFDHLKHVNGGLLHVAGDFAEHLTQLDEALSGRSEPDGRARKFVEAFVRPHGLSAAATPRLVEALERLAAQPVPLPAPQPGLARLVRPRLLARGERLQREALAAIEGRAARQAFKARRAEVVAAKAVPGVNPATPAPAAADARARAEKRSWSLLAAEYRALDERERLRFAKATHDLLPGEVLQDAVRAERLDYPDAEIRLRVTTRAERLRLKACAKEPFTIEWIHRCVRADDVLYDIGANVGAYSLVAAKKPGGAARVFAFEPSYATVAALSANIVLNGVTEQVTPMPVALSNTDAMTVFGLRALEAGSARHTLGGGPSDEGPTLYQQPVMTLRLDTLIERFGLSQPNHIKLDVDGGELAVLEGAAHALASPALRSMLVEVSTSLSGAIAEILERHGLRLDSKVNVKNKAGEYRVWYGLFTRDAGSDAERAVQVQFVAR